MASHKQRGFSLTETLITVVVIGLLAAIGTFTVSNVASSTRERKLSSDVATLNRSVAAFIASGGDLSESKSADDVLNALKRSFTNASRMPGLSGAKIDERLSFQYQDAGDAQGKSWRAYWNAGENRFVLAQSGDGAGIKAFGFDGNTAVDATGTNDAKTPFFYAEQGTWIWDYKDATASVAPGPSSLPVTEVADSTPSPPGPPTGSGPGGAATPLSTPTFSIASGGFPITSFDLPLALSNPNPAGSSDLYYSVDFGNWKPYTGTILVPPGALVAAQAIATSDLYSNSSRVDQSYTALPTDLLPPVITPSRPEFGLFTGRLLTVTLADINPSSISLLEYRIGGDPWQTYTGSFSLLRDSYPSGALVQARAVPKNPYYVSSIATLRTLGVEAVSLTGTASGSFSNPVGGPQMATNLTGGSSSDYFEWGRDKSNQPSQPLSKSWLDYYGVGFNNIASGQRFQIGLLDYYNGTILGNTGADAVSFSVNLNMALNGASANSSFSFDLELINVANRGKDIWEDADYVRLANPYAEKTVSFNGINFQLRIEFGESTSNGLTQFGEFHVIENERARTQVYGTLVEVGTLSFNR